MFISASYVPHISFCGTLKCNQWTASNQNNKQVTRKGSKQNPAIPSHLC